MKINTIPIQAQLVSGNNIKTINGNNVLGAGNLNLNSAISQQKFTYIDTASGTPITGTSQQMVFSALIRARTFDTEGIIDFVCRLKKTGTNGNWSVYLYKNTTNSLTGASWIGSFGQPFNSTQIYVQVNRCLRLTGGTLKCVYLGSSIINDSITQSNAETSTTFNLAVDNYIIVAVQLFGSGTDVASSTFGELLGYE